jgi:signal transduction histidine kinase
VSPPSIPLAVHLKALGAALASQREAILQAWRAIVRREGAQGSARALSRVEINDHIPHLLLAFEQALSAAGDERSEAAGCHHELAAITDQAPDTPDAAAHGLRRWQQGYDVVELSVELGRLNECVMAELERYAAAHPALEPAVMAEARRLWASAFTGAIRESTTQYQRLHQLEAAGHIEELETALEDLLELEQVRGRLWQQAAHDLRGNVAVVANATAGLALSPLRADVQQRFLRMLQHNVQTLNHLLNDVTLLARLHAGEEQRQVTSFDAAVLLSELGEGLQGLAQQRSLSLSLQGPRSLVVEGDAVKTLRIAQNLILNALAYTSRGGVELSWSDASQGDIGRWMLVVRDSGPGLAASGSTPLTAALEQATVQADATGDAETGGVSAPDGRLRSRAAAPGGEGLGLSICKRLCDLLDASVEVESTPGVGTTFRILLPSTFSS